MKEKLKKLLYVPKTNREDMYRELQKLWGQVDPHDFQHYTEQLTYKIKDIIIVCGLATNF